MKIGILTLPLNSNYGGILQAYALMHVLRKIGHESWLISIHQINDCPFYLKDLVRFKRFIYKHTKKYKNNKIKTEQISKFINNELIPKTDEIRTVDNFDVLNKYGFNAYIVGSDQVWRPSYVPCIENYFFDFLENTDDVLKISYAASFGVDDWTFSKKQTENCNRLINKFNGVSVREDSAKYLCKEYFGINPVSVLDPTFLLELNVYHKLIKNKDPLFKTADLFVYLLQPNNENIKLVNKIANILSYDLNYLTLQQTENKPLPSIENWLASIYNSKFVVTDSFHACVFSILFNKPFVVYGNQNGGISRIESLLNKFNLGNRLITSLDDFKVELIYDDLSWKEINSRLVVEKEISFQFLINALKS